MPKCALDRLPSTFTYEEALTAGLTRYRLYALRDAGIIEPIARGLYRRTDTDDLVDLDLFEIARRAPHATLCLATALVHHDLTDANPASIDVAVPSGAHRPNLSIPVTWHRFDRATFDIGRGTLPVDASTNIGIYNAERCIVDAFRLRWREGDDLAYVAIRRWLRREGSSPAILYEMSRHFPQTIMAITKAVQTLQYE